MNVKRLRPLYVELYKTINKLNLKFMRDIFKLRFTSRPVRQKYKMNMIIPEFKVSHGKKGLRTFGHKLWSSLPYHVKSSANLESFKRTNKHGDGVRCPVRFIISVNKLIFRFNENILFLLKLELRKESQ